MEDQSRSAPRPFTTQKTTKATRTMEDGGREDAGYELPGTGCHPPGAFS